MVIDRLLAAIDAFVGGAPQFDDITLLIARRLTADCLALCRLDEAGPHHRPLPTATPHPQRLLLAASR